MPTSRGDMNEPEFDFVIVGAGSAGCAVAERLSRNGRFRILLLEAGGEANHPWIPVPLGVGRLLADPSVLWAFETEPEPEMKGQKLYWPRGRVLGGSSSINGMLFVRGDPLAYDRWRDLGCPGWGYQDVLPVFKRIEDRPGGDKAYRGVGGPIAVTDIAHKDAITEAFFNGCQSYGIEPTEDYNAKSYEGVSYLQMSIANGRRCSAETGYLRKARGRGNLSVMTRALVKRVVFDGSRAVGVEYHPLDHHGRPDTGVFAGCRYEVILCGGALCSPLILERSGVGDQSILERRGIRTVRHLPGVGCNLQDHLNVRITYETMLRITLNDALNSKLRGAMQMLRYLLTKRGLMATSTVTVHAIARSRVDITSPDIKLQLAHVTGRDRFSMAKGLGVDGFSGFSLNYFKLYPASRGSVHVRSRDPLDDPVIKANYLHDERDRQDIVRGLHILRELARQPAISRLIVREVLPGADAQSDQELLEYARSTGQTSWHTVGSCKMGRDSESVVDSDLRVHDLDGLRVADTSVIPIMVSSNINAAAYLVGERCADFLLSRWAAE